MAGPIIEALRRFRENRPERVAARRSFIRDLINPLASIDETDRAQGATVMRRPLRRGGAFASLGGVQTARHDHKGREQVMPAPRKMQDDPAGPDTTPSRAYDGDGTGTAMQATPVSRPRNAQPAEPDRSYGTAAPEVIRSETMGLPAPSSGFGMSVPTEVEALRQQVAASDARVNQLQQYMAQQGEQGQSTAFTMAGKLAQMEMAKSNNARVALSQAEERHRGSPEYKVAQRQALIRRAFETGDWQTFHTHVTSEEAFQTKAGPYTDAEIAPNMARPHITKHIWDSFVRHNGMPTDPVQRSNIIRAAQYAFPLATRWLKEDTGDPTTKVVDRAATEQRFVGEMNALYNRDGDPGVELYFRAMAHLAFNPDTAQQEQ